MKFEEIEIGKKYFHTYAATGEDKAIRKKNRVTLTIYVLSKDHKKQSVLASIGGTPAQWFVRTKFNRWTFESPEEMPSIIQHCICGAIGAARLRKRRKQIIYKGKKVMANWWVYECDSCKETFTTDESDNLSLKRLKRDYERKQSANKKK